MRKPSLAALALALLACAVALPAASASLRPRDPEVWVTIGNGQLEALESFLGRERLDGLLTVLEGNDVARLARTRESRLGDLAAALHARFQRCGGFTAHRTRAEALAALDAADRPAAPLAVAYTIDNGPTVRALIAPMAAPNVQSTIQSLSTQFLNRYYTATTGVQAAEWLRSLWAGYASGAGRDDVRVWLRPHSGWAQPSVIAMIPGTQFPKEAIVVGGHLDSINSQVPSSQRPTASAPGADDDASGVASLTETFRAALVTGYRPARTVFFVAYAAEEVGLRGSADIAEGFRTAKYQVIGKLQFDMTNYKGSSIDIGMLTDASYTNAAQNQFLQSLVTTYALDLVPGTGATQATSTCGYACSDHASWNQRGFPSSIAFESLFSQYNPNIHKTTDTLANSDPTAGHALKFSKLGAAYMAELAKGTIPPGLEQETARRR